MMSVRNLAEEMSQGHLLFAVMTTAYIFIGIAFEEHDMAATFGAAYRSYRERVPMVLPFRTGKRVEGTAPTHAAEP